MNCGVDVDDIAVLILFTCWKLWGDGLSVTDVDDVILILILKLTLGDPLLSELVDGVTLELKLGDRDTVVDSLVLKLEVKLGDRDTVVDSLVLKLEVCDRVSDGKMEELIVVDGVGDKDMDSVEDEDLDVDSDDDPDWEDDTSRDLVREVVMDTLREGESEAIALIDGVEAAVAERERLWLWLNVEDVDPDVVAIEDMVMDLLADMETLSDEEEDPLTDVDGDTSVLGLEEALVL